VYGYPRDAAARVAVEALRAAKTEVALVRLVAFEEATLALYQALLAAIP
jgi:O-acetyl-ADP-ribose deacetylase (regulator of RNase III)